MQNNGSVRQKLFADDTQSAYAILDGASVPGLPDRLRQHHPEFVCLYRGELAPDMAAVAPYLVHLQVDSEFTDWLTNEGWGKHWGIFVLSSADLRGLRQHFRTLLTVYDPEAKPVLFRYYDPRVLRTFLPTCDSGELSTMFGPVGCYVLEDEDGESGLRFLLASGSLKRETFLVRAAAFE
jgi:Domain of unknown function (DUF4123)